MNSNPNFAKGDFKGDGKPQLFWYRFRIDPDGTGTMAFPDEVFHMFDLVTPYSVFKDAFGSLESLLRPTVK